MERMEEHADEITRDTRFDSSATAVDLEYLPTLKAKESKVSDEKDLGFISESSKHDETKFDEENSSLPIVLSSGKTPWLSVEKKELIAVFAMIGLVGLNDASLGANLNSMQEFYGKTDDEIAAVFFFQSAGYLAACLASSFITHKIGLRYSLIMAASLLCSGCLLISFAPPYPAFVISLALLGGGSGTFDSNLTTVISHYESPLTMSIFYSFFGFGALASPLLVGALLDANVKWNLYYYIPFVLEILLSIAVFPIFGNYVLPVDEPELDLPMDTISLEEDQKIAIASLPINETARSKFKRVSKLKACWVGFLLIFLAFGQGDMLTGWIVNFLIRERGVPLATSRFELSGYWGGVAVGRVGLAFVGNGLGERTFSILALGCAAGCATIIWLVKNNVADAVALAFLGCFLGPVTPKVFSMVSARVPASLKGLAMSLLISIGLVGSAILPIMFGLAADKGYLSALPAVVMVTCLIAAAAWVLVPRPIED